MTTTPTLYSPNKSQRETHESRQSRSNALIQSSRYVVTFAIAICGAIAVYRTNLSDLTIPWNLDGDIAAGYARARSLRGSWFGMTDSNLGAPFSANFREGYPPELLQVLITRILVNIFQDPFIALNIQYLLSFGLSASAFLWLSTRLQIDWRYGVPLSLAFAWLPFRFIRYDYGHLALVDYFMIPFGIWIVLDEFRHSKEGQAQFRTAESKELVKKLALAAVVGASGSYFAFYLALLTISISMVPIILRLGWRCSLISLIRKLLISIAFLSTSVLATVGTGGGQANKLISGRSAGESLIFGGELFRLFIPWTSFQPSSIRSLLGSGGLEWTVAPPLVSLGLWLVLLWFLRTGLDYRGDRELHQQLVVALTFLTFLSLAFYTVTGLGTVFAYVVSPLFRAWNRFSLVISCLSLVAVGVALDRRFAQSSRRLRSVLFSGIVALVVTTQLLPLNDLGVGSRPSHQTQKEISDLRDVGEIIGERTAENCRILQLPILRAFSSDSSHQLSATYQYWLPLFVPDRQWSFGGPSGTYAGEYWRTLEQSGRTSMFIAAVQHNFCAVVIDRRAYEIDSQWFNEATQWQNLAQYEAEMLSPNLYYVSLQNAYPSTAGQAQG